MGLEIELHWAFYSPNTDSPSPSATARVQSSQTRVSIFTTICARPAVVLTSWEMATPTSVFRLKFMPAATLRLFQVENVNTPANQCGNGALKTAIPGKEMRMEMLILAPAKVNVNCWSMEKFPSLPSSSGSSKHLLKSVNCASSSSSSVQQVQEQREVDSGIICEPCNGQGWVVCDFCKGQKTNVKAENKRVYRRCPSCKAVGYLLCSKCKVFKCVTFPNYSDGEQLSF
ncbi:unnamed protein product [Linum trigynum]|uniref:Uncharacterized protein n=1 Tax=Linum trigynum TaxID=586398 RepID=A0AAV2EI79_9ROSI